MQKNLQKVIHLKKSLLSKLYENDLINEKYDIPLMFVPKSQDIYTEMELSNNKLKKEGKKFFKDIKDTFTT